jgi:hypothetical protein
MNCASSCRGRTAHEPVRTARHHAPVRVVINLFTTSPGLFVLEKVLKHRVACRRRCHRGTAVEAGVVHGLLDLEGASDEDAIAVAARRCFASARR